MKKEKVQLIFNKELSKINYDVIGSLTDLKLHLIAMEENCDDELFSMFCQQEYDLFTEELEVKMKHVGRTSKFRIDYENGLYGNVYYYDDFINDINNIMNNKGCGSGTTYHNNQKIEICVIIYPQPNEDRRIETIMHEKRHCEDFILEKLDIDDMEAAAYLAGWLAVKFINK